MYIKLLHLKETNQSNNYVVQYESTMTLAHSTETTYYYSMWIGGVWYIGKINILIF